MAIRTTSDNVSSKRKTLDEVSLSSSESETQHDHRSTSTSYVPMDPNIGPYKLTASEFVLIAIILLNISQRFIVEKCL